MGFSLSFIKIITGKLRLHEKKLMYPRWTPQYFTTSTFLLSIFHFFIGVYFFHLEEEKKKQKKIKNKIKSSACEERSKSTLYQSFLLLGYPAVTRSRGM